MTHSSATVTNQTDTLKRLYITLKQTQSKLSKLRAAAKEPIAVIGMACRFPGGADTPEKFWNLLMEGKDAVIDAPSDRWNGDAWLDEDPNAPGKMFTIQGGFLTEPVDTFDAAFFNISPKEARALDPQQRMLLEVSRDAFENAGIAPFGLKGSACGVFLGMSSDDYALAHRHSGDHEVIDAYAITGTTFSTACGRLSYTYGFQGPSMTVDTACSSALTAVHLACKSLRSKESEMALVGGINLMLSPESHVCFSKLRAISPDGRCKSFSADANGYVRGEGCGLVILKRLSDAQKDNDRILGLIRGSAVNQDGKSNGLTAPNGNAQKKVILSALEDAGLPPENVGFIETHGTGTSLGDPIEAEAVGEVFGPHFSMDRKLIIGSCKTNIGHLEPASGIAALIKTVLCLQHGTIPPNLHFNTPSPFIPWDEVPLFVPRMPMAWKPNEKPPEKDHVKNEQNRIHNGQRNEQKRGWKDDEKKISIGERVAGINAFGFSGTNVHIIISETPLTTSVPDTVHDFNPTKADDRSEQNAFNDLKETGLDNPSSPANGNTNHLLPISAKSEAALTSLQDRYLTYLEHPENRHSLAAICNTATCGRDHFAYRMAAVGSTPEALIKGLSKQSPIKSGAAPSTAFLFTGQGSQYPGMGFGLYQAGSVFKETLDLCNEILTPLLNTSLTQLLYNRESNPDALAEILSQTRFTQPALFAVEYALYSYWRSLGIVPDFMMGHSVGEYVAACAAGLFSLEDGLMLICRRAELMQGLPSGGAMAAVMANGTQVADVVSKGGYTISVAAYNGPKQTVISGAAADVDAVTRAFKEQGMKVATLVVSHAFHSHLMNPILDEFEKTAASIAFKKPSIRLISNVSGEIGGEEMADAAYWRNHIRQPVQFLKSMQTLHREGVTVYVEAGPKPTLLGMGKAALSDTKAEWLPSLRSGQPDRHVLFTSLGKLYTAGFEIDWNPLHKTDLGKPVTLPNYPFEKKRFWMPIPSASGPGESSRITHFERNELHPSGVRYAPPNPHQADGSSHAHNASSRLHPLIDRKVTSPLLQKILFETTFSQDALPFLDDHRIFERMVVSAASHLSLLQGAAINLFSESGCSIEDILFTQALVIPEDHPKTVQLILTPVNDASPSVTDELSVGIKLIREQHKPRAEKARTFDFSIISFFPGEDHFTQHVTGRIAPKKPTEQIGRLSLSNGWQHCTTHWDAGEVYEFQKQRQISLGPTYRWIDSIRTGSRQAVCRLVPPIGLDFQSWGLHPGLIDSCFGLMVTAAGGDPDATYIPFALEEFRCRRQSKGKNLQAVAQIRPTSLESKPESGSVTPSEKLIGDIQLFDQDGLVAEWIGLEGRQVDPASLLKADLHGSNSARAGATSETDGMIYEVQWEPLEINADTSPGNTARVGLKGGEWIVIGDTDGAAKSLNDRLNNIGATSNCWSWDILSEFDEKAHDNSPLQTMPDPDTDLETQLNSPSLEGVVHLVSSAWGKKEAHENIGGINNRKLNLRLEALQKKICGLPLTLLKKLIQQKNTSAEGRPPRLFLVTQGTQSVTETENRIDPHGGTLWGLGRVIALEHPEVNLSLVDLDPDENMEIALDTLADLLSKLSDDLSSSVGSEFQFAIRNKTLFIPRLIRSGNHLSPTTRSTADFLAGSSSPSKPALPFSKAHSYLVTGGMGGLGLVTAKWLAENQAGCIVLAGRSAPSIEVQETVDSLKSEYPDLRIETRTVDMADPEQINSLFDELETDLPPLNGVIHTAGFLNDGMLSQLEWPKFWEVMAPKVTGAFVMGQRIGQLKEDLDLFICFSSIVSILGTPAQGNYASANAFLDGICRQRKSQGKQALSINWGPFDQTGMAARLSETNKKRITKQGFTLLPPELGLVALERLLASNLSEGAVMDVNWYTFIDRYHASLSSTSRSGNRVQPGERFLQYLIQSEKENSESTSAKSNITASPRTERSYTWLTELIQVPEYDRQAWLFNKIQSATAESLGLEEPDEVAADARLFDLGLDSLMAVELKNTIEKNLDCRLKSTLVFDYPTVETLTGYLMENIPMEATRQESNSAEHLVPSTEKKPDKITDTSTTEKESHYDENSSWDGKSRQSTPPSNTEQYLDEGRDGFIYTKKTVEEAVAALSDEEAEMLLLKELEELDLS